MVSEATKKNTQKNQEMNFPREVFFLTFFGLVLRLSLDVTPLKVRTSGSYTFRLLVLHTSAHNFKIPTFVFCVHRVKSETQS